MVATLTPQQANQFLSSQGIQQGMSEADTQAAIAANPQAAQAWQQFSTPGSAGFGGTPQPQILAPQPGAGRGVTPMTAEPLHQFERQGLTQLAGQDTQALQQALAQLQGFAGGGAGQFTSELAQPFLQQAGQAIQGGMAPIDMAQIQSMANPYAAGIKENLTEAGQRAKAALMSSQGLRGARSFGDTSMGQQLGGIEGEVIRSGRDVDYNAFNRALESLTGERGRQLTGGQALGGLARGAQDITTAGGTNQLRAMLANIEGQRGLGDVQSGQARDALGAGRYIRDYQQDITDQLSQDILARQDFQGQNLTDVLNMLQSGFGQTQTFLPTANTLQQAGLGIGSASNILRDLFGGGQ